MSGARFSPSLAFGSLGALLLALALGLLGREGTAAAAPVGALAAFFEPVGQLWMNALRVTVVPIVVTQLLAAMVRPEAGRGLGRLGARTVALFVALLTGLAIASTGVIPALLALRPPSPDVLEAFGAMGAEAGASTAIGEAAGDPWAWIPGIVPVNLIDAAARGDIFQILVAVVVFGLAASRLPDDRRRPLAELFQSLADATMIVVAWILWATPFGVFSLVLTLVLETGVDVVGALGLYIVVLSALFLLATVLLYPLAVVFGRTPLGGFARAVAPAQLVAMGTQSSVASLPALVEGAEDSLRLPPAATGFVLPLAVASFRPNQAIYMPFKLFFLAAVFEVALTPGVVGAFLVYIVATSFTVPGIPRGAGGGIGIPPLLAAGMPLEGIILLEAVETIPDIFMTLFNVTADMTVATIVTGTGAASVDAAAAEFGAATPSPGGGAS